MASSASEAIAEDEAEDPRLALEQAALDKLRGMSIEGVLLAGHEAMLRQLVARAIAGTISHQELAVLRNVLRDNGMVINKVIDGKALKPLPLPEGDDIPELPAPEYE